MAFGLPTRLVLFIGLLLFTVLGFTSIANAVTAAPTSLTTSPITLGLNIGPGTNKSETLQVKNNTAQALQITMVLKTFGAYGNSGEAAITNFPANNPAAGYITLSPKTFVAQPGQWSYVKASISIPKTASLGYYYAVVFQPNLPTPTNLAPGTAVIKGSNAILILINTGTSNEVKQLQVAKFSVNKKLFEYLPASFSVTVYNPGNIYLAPVGDIYISKHSDGSDTIDTLPVNAGSGNILPFTNRQFSASWTNGFPVFVPVIKNGQPLVNKSGNPVEKLKWNFADVNKLRFGKYYAKLALAYNNGTREVLLSSTVSFWVIPWKLLIVLLAIVIILLFSVFIVIRSIYRKIRGYSKKRRSKPPTLNE